MRCKWLMLAALVATHVNAAPLLLTGEVAARDSQVFVAPQSDNWMVQIAWMVDEGLKVAKGDAVVQYDSASIASNLEQLEANLRKVRAESQRNDLVQDIALAEAEHNLKVANLNLQKAQLDADIPKDLLSQLQYEQYQLALTRAQNTRVEAEEALAQKRKDVVAEKQRSQVDIASAENELERVQVMLDNMTQYAGRSGTALYVEHPWTRQKIRQGDSVERGFSVLEIPSTDDLQIRAWLNEIDVAQLSPGQPVNIRFDALPGLLVQGKVERIGRQAEPKQHWGDSGYLNVDIRFDKKPDVDLLPGMSVRVEVGEAL